METKEVILPGDKRITIRKPLVRDLRAVGHIKNDTERSLALLGNLSGLTTEEIDALDLFEFNQLRAAMDSFLPKEDSQVGATA
ncbi:MAG: phage tail assembly protein [Helicobacteraceae bacterium]|jgi:hypothetical protein|nr:phage tail assembly protein [Helicobacteraceae bacterium]